MVRNAKTGHKEYGKVLLGTLNQNEDVDVNMTNVTI